LASTGATNETGNVVALDEEQARARWGLVIYPWTLVVLAWVSILLAFATGRSFLIDHDYLLQTSHFPWLIAFIIFLFSWQVMTVAMMLPSALSTITLVGRMSRGVGPHWFTQGIFILGYTFIWSLFACIAFFGDTLVHQLVNHWYWLYTHSWFVGATILAVAGSFQFSAWKRSCLRRCDREDIGHRPLANAGMIWRLGMRYGVFCLGTCWAIMLIMFGIGMKSLLWMVVLASIVLLEKEIPGRQRFTMVIGAGFLVLALVWALFPLLG
jgi:predicted metal-binding membrane protein